MGQSSDDEYITLTQEMQQEWEDERQEEGGASSSPAVTMQERHANPRSRTVASLRRIFLPEFFVVGLVLVLFVYQKSSISPQALLMVSQSRETPGSPCLSNR